MDQGGRWRRALVVLALLLGIAAMHAVVAPMMTGHTASAAPAEHTGAAMSQGLTATAQGLTATAQGLTATAQGVTATVQGVTADRSGADEAHGGPATLMSGGSAGPAAPTPMMHDLMHLCLAVLVTAVAWGMAMIVVVIGRGREARTAVPRRTRSVTVAARPPPRTAVRLAQLCVLRN